MNQFTKHKQLWISWLSGLSLLVAPAIWKPALGAERIYVNYSAFERSIPVEALEIYAKEGRITNEFRTYTRYLNQPQLDQLRAGLQAKVDLDPVTISQFLYSPIGEQLLRRVGQVVQTPSRQPGFYAIRSALILAAADPQGLTALNVLKRFPAQGVRVDIAQGLGIINAVQRLVGQTRAAVTSLRNQSSPDQISAALKAFSQGRDLRFRGPFAWKKVTLNLTDQSRVQLGLSDAPRQFPADIYLPELSQPRPLPIVVISHGLGSDRQTFDYLAEHLASYGFVVAVPEHLGSSSQQLIALLNGQANDVSEPSEFVDRPLDIKFLLDELDRLSQTDPAFQGRLNLNQVGVFGQSYGGYTALALAGATLNFDQLERKCGPNLDRSLNVSLVLQCRALVLPQRDYNLSDPRVKAVVAVNPVGSAVFGQEGLSQIKVPVMIIGGSADTIAPALPEQIEPFTWLTTPQKYLTLIEGGTHLSVTGESASSGTVPVPSALVGPSPGLARSYLDALSAAFFQTHVANQPAYARYLNPDYTTLLSQQSLLRLSLNQTLTPGSLQQVLGGSATPAIVPSPALDSPPQPQSPLDSP